MVDLVKFLLGKKRIEEIIIKNKIIFLFVLFFVNILIMFLSKVIFVELEDLGLINPINNDKRIEHSGYELFIFSGLLVPALEELINRLWLKFNKYYLPISISLFILLFTYIFIFKNDIDKLSILSLDFFMSFFIASLFFFLILYLVIKFKTKIILIYNNNIRLVLFFSALFFSLLHLSMYNFDVENSIFLIFLFLFPYMLAGIFLGYLRLKLGFITVVCFHVFYNSFFIGLKLFLIK